MKENSLDSHRGKVADSKVGATAKADPTATNFDDDYNEWELGIGDLIIDLDADIEKNNEKSGVSVVQQTATAFSMSSGKGRANSNAAVEHQATVDKGLKMKIKRTKPTKTSEAKHEIVKSDTKPSSPVETLNGNVGLATTNAVDGKPKHMSSKGRGGSHREKKERTKEKGSGSSSSSSSKAVDMNGLLMSSSSAGPTMPTPTIKLTTSNVNMNSITSPTVNLGVPANLVSLNMSTSNSTTYTSNSSGPHSGNTTSQAPMPTLSVKLDSKFSSVPITSTTSSSSTTTPTATVKLEDTVRKLEDSMRGFSMKRMRINVEKSVEKVDRTTSPRPPEMHDMCIGTSVGTITEPECLGPCEPGTSVTLEGIVWHETEGGVLVVNVTWRGKTYVGTLLDCTKHDWAPPRFCESPTSDVEARTPKGRGKRGRSNAATPVDMSNYTETRSSVHSKLRNAGKGRRATNTGFQAPPSPAKSDSAPIVGVKRKGRTPDLELNRELEVRSSKRSRSQSRGTPTNSSTPTEQPNSPVLIECPKPNCKKRYRHINGLRYHQTHAHHGSGSGVEDSLDEQTKDMSSDNEESMQENVSVPHSPGAVADKNLRSSPRPFTGKTPAPPERKASPSSQPNASVPGAGSDTFTQPPSTQPTSDLTTLATVAISDSKGGVKISSVLRFGQSSPNHAGIPPETETANVPTPPAIAAPAVSSPSPLNTSNTVQQGSQRCTTTTTTTTTTTISTITTSPTSQVYQFTHAPIGSLTTTTVSTVRSPSTTTVPVTSNNLTPTTTIGSPPTMATSFNTASVEKPKPKQEKTEKFKLKPPLTVQRPLTQPTGPPPQVIPISPSLPPSQPNVMTPSASPQAAVTHPTLAANIKPIQPKPVVLNDPNTLNPSLENIKKEKSKHKKKSKDKERRAGEGSPGQNDGKLQGLEVMDKLNGGVYSKVTEVLTKDGVRELVAPHLQNSAYPITPVSRTIESPLDVNAGDGSNTANENVQSPAYSDISDANDTAPVLESEVQNKEKEEEKTKAPSEPTPPPASNLGPFSMYYPYRQPPYLMPSVPPQTSVPQTVAPDKPKEGNTEKVDGCIKEQKQWNDRERISGSNTSAETEKKETMGTLSQPANQTNVSDYQLQQQKLLQQQYTYPYGYSYPYQVDPSYHMHLMTSDPHIKQQVEKCMEERDRLYKDLLDRPKEAANKETPEKNKVQVKIEPEKRKSCSSDIMKAPSQSATSSSSHKEREVHHGQPQSTKLDSSSSNLKEKQNENHQILKENIELKSQMENKSKYERYNQSVLYHPEEARHYYPHIYAEKYLESQKPEEVRRKEENAPPKQPMADTKTQGPAKESIKPPTSVHSSHSSSSPKSNPNPVKELVNKEVPKKETSLTEGSKNSDNTEGSSKDKRDAERPKQQEGQKPTMETQGPPPPTSSYAYMHPQFMQSSPYAPISFDHSMYRSMLMTQGAFPASPYLHPQMRYHVPPNDHQSGHLSPKMHSGGSTKALDLLQHHASQYYTSHKIHELQERALKSPPSSLNQSTPTAINKIVDNPLAVKNEPNTPGNSLERRSPPLQRHLHTHHHTHVGVGYPINIAQYDPYGSKPLVRH